MPRQRNVRCPDGDVLVARVRRQRPVNNPVFNIGAGIFPVLHERDGSYYRVRQLYGLNIFFNLILAVEMRDAGIFIGIGDRCIDKVAYPGLFGGIRQVAPLPDFPLLAVFPEILDGKTP